MNKTGKILTAGALLVGASTLSHCNGITEKDTKKNLVEVLEKDSVKDDNNTACFLVDQFTEKANDSAEKNDSCFQVNISDLKGTPFYGPGKMIVPNYGNYLGYSQAITIINDYNKRREPIIATDCVSADETLSVPFIYPELKSYFPENWADLVAIFPEYKNISESDLIFIARCDNGKSALAYYKNGKLTLATHVSLGNPHLRRAIRTTSGVFTLKRDIIRRRSRAFGRSPMPYSILVEGAGNGGVYLHQGKVDGSNLSHGCCRVPGLYQKYLYENLPEYSKGILHDLYNPTLIKH